MPLPPSRSARLCPRNNRASQASAPQISKRTKEALAAAKARGVRLGGNRGAIISDEAREVSREARHAASEARAADLSPVIAETPSSRRHEPGRARNRADGARHPDRTGQSQMDAGSGLPRLDPAHGIGGRKSEAGVEHRPMHF